MQYGDRHATGLPKAGYHAPVYRRTIGRADWHEDSAPVAKGRGDALLPLLLVIVLAVAAIGLSPVTASSCAKLEEFPCGP